MNKIVYKAFTNQYHGLVNCLRSNIYVEKNGTYNAIAVWDTGAMGTCISNELAKKMKLVPTGKQTISTPSGFKLVNTYFVNIILPNRVKVVDVPVCDSEIGNQQIDVLIGMDIITCGDFCISNFQNKTVLTYRTPSKQVTDYVKESNIDNLINKHGKGKRKK